MVYGLDDTTAARIQSWRAHGYRVTVMTGVAWGRYGSYLRGDFDGKEHWDETQQEKSGNLTCTEAARYLISRRALPTAGSLPRAPRLPLKRVHKPSIWKSLSFGRVPARAPASNASGRATITSPGKLLTARPTRSTELPSSSTFSIAARLPGSLTRYMAV